MRKYRNKIAVARKGRIAFAALLFLLLKSSATTYGADKIVPPDKAIVVLEKLEARIERAQWTYQCMSGKLTDPRNLKTATFRTDLPIKTTVIIEPISGRYRCDTEGVAEWVNGPAPYIGYRQSYSFDLQQQREYVLEKQGVNLPREDQNTGRGTIQGEHRGEFMKKWGTSGSGVWMFPPYMFGMKLSELLRDRLERKSPLRITEDQQGVWTINTVDNQPLAGVMLQILYDPTKGAMRGARWVEDEKGNPGKLWIQMQVELTKTEDGFWVPRQIDQVNIQDRTIGRSLFSDIKVNHPVDESAFRFVFPLGTQVTDELEKKRYIVGKGAVNDEAATLAYAQLHGLRLEENAPRPRGASPTRGLLIITITTILLLATVLLLRWRSKIIHQRRLLLFIALTPSTLDAAELSERGEWLVKYGDKEIIYMSQCGMNATVLTLNCFGIRYDLRQVAEALPPTQEGISFADIQTVLQAHGLHCVPRQRVSLTDLETALRPNMMAIFPVSGPQGYNHYLAAINHPRQGCLLLDPPRRSPVPLREAFGAPHLQPLSGLVLFVGRGDQKPTLQSDRVTLSPQSFDFGAFSITDSNASKPLYRKVAVTNSSQLPVLVSRVNSACGCITTEWRGGVLRAGETHEVSFLIIRGAWGHGWLQKETAFVFVDRSEAAVIWKGEGLSDPEIQHLDLSTDTLRIDLDSISATEPLERYIRIGFAGARADELCVSSGASWLKAAFESSASDSGTIRVRIMPGKNFRDSHHVEGRIFLATHKAESPAFIKVILFRKEKWGTKPDVVTISRQNTNPQSVEVVSRNGDSHGIKRLRPTEVPQGVVANIIEQPSGRPIISVRATHSSDLGWHALKIVVIDDREISTTVPLLVRIVE